MGNKGNVKIKLSPESADATTRMSDMETWTVQPTMVRGRKPLIDPASPTEPTAEDAIRRKYNTKGKKANPGGKKVEDTKPKKHILKAKAPRPEAEVDPDAAPKASDYHRSKASRALITKRLEELNRLDCDRFPQNPLFDVDGNCRMKGVQDVTWELIKFHNLRSPEIYGDTIHKMIEKVRSQLSQPTPVRQSWLQLIKDLASFVQCTAGLEKTE